MTKEDENCPIYIASVSGIETTCWFPPPTIILITPTTWGIPVMPHWVVQMKSQLLLCLLDVRVRYKLIQLRFYICLWIRIQNLTIPDVNRSSRNYPSADIDPPTPLRKVINYHSKVNCFTSIINEFKKYINFFKLRFCFSLLRMATLNLVQTFLNFHHLFHQNH